jgi:hypothetical protein
LRAEFPSAPGFDPLRYLTETHRIATDINNVCNLRCLATTVAGNHDAFSGNPRCALRARESRTGLNIHHQKQSACGRGFDDNQVRQ